MRQLFLALSLVALSTVATAQVIPLSQARTQLTFPKYSSDQKQTLVDQTEFFIKNLFVHRELKIKDFGAGADPLPKLAELKKNARDLSDADLNAKLQEIFSGLHDLHTNYFAPAPVACAASFVPVRFESALDGNRRGVFVSRKLKIQADAVKDVNVGDELLEVNGQTAEAFVKELETISGGANPAAMQFRAVQMVSFRSFLQQPIPKEDSLKLKFSRDGKSFDLEVPWFAFIDDSCIDSRDANGSIKELPKDLPLWLKMNVAEDPFQKRFNKVFGKPGLVKPDQNWARLDNALAEVFDVNAIQTPAGTIGYVHLKAFSWSNRSLDVGTVIEALRHEIEGRLGDAISIVVDVRGNPGGYIVLAEKLIQLFSPHEVSTTTVRLFANDLNEKIFLKANGADNRWSEAVRTAVKQGKPYTGNLAITPSSEANSLGQVWYRPVVVLVDAGCYSACDLFAAGMQDNSAGTVIGLHKNTGAGGANVMEYNVFRSIMSGTDNPFLELPFGQNMRVAWRQTVRGGKHAGEFIEDAGILADKVVPLKKADLGAESKELMSAIHKIIDELIPNHKSGLAVRQGNSVLLANGAAAKWTEKVYGADALQILQNGKVVAYLKPALSESPKALEINLESLKGEWLDQPVVLIGKRSGKEVFRAVRELNWRGEYTAIPKDGLKTDFADGKLGVFRPVLLKGLVDSGWQVADKVLRIGKGPQYEPRVLARVFAPLKLDGKGGKMVFDISVEAEDQNDTLRIYFTNPDTSERMILFGGSNVAPKFDISAELPEGWDRADIVFEFESDENWNLTGPKLGNFRFTQP